MFGAQPTVKYILDSQQFQQIQNVSSIHLNPNTLTITISITITITNMLSYWTKLNWKSKRFYVQYVICFVGRINVNF